MHKNNACSVKDCSCHTALKDTSSSDAWIESQIDEWLQHPMGFTHSQEEAFLRNSLTQAIEKGREEEKKIWQEEVPIVHEALDAAKRDGAYFMREAIVTMLSNSDLKDHFPDTLMNVLHSISSISPDELV